MEDRNRKVEVRSLNKNKFGGLGLYPNSSGVVLVPQLIKGGWKTGLTKEEETHLEKSMHLKEGELNKKSEFWSTLELRVKNKIILDLTDDTDFLKYKFANVHTRIAQSMEKMQFGAEFVIIDEETEAKADSIKINYEIEAFSIFTKLTEDNKKGILQLYGIKTPFTSTDMVNSKLHKFLKQDPKKFCEIANDKSKDIKILIEDLLNAGIIKKEKFFFKNGDDVIGTSTEEVIEYLKAPKNSAVYSSFKVRLQKIKEDKEEKA